MLTAATFNLRNLDAKAPASRIQAIARILIHELRGPQILALQEIAVPAANSEAVVPTAATALYQRLTSEIRHAGGPEYRWLECPPHAGQDGGQPGANIRSGLLYDPGHLQPISPSPQQQPSTARPDARHDTHGSSPGIGRLGSNDPAFTGCAVRHWRPGRKPLVASFSTQGPVVTVICCHLKSMRSASTRERSHARKQRHAQAVYISNFVQRLLADAPGAPLLLLGDMNDTPGSKTLDILKGESLCNLVERLPARDRYSRRHGGRPQALDHILVNHHLATGASIRIPHVNTNIAPELQCSDHDPVVAEIKL